MRRCRGSAIRGPGSSWSASRPPRTEGTARAGSSPETGAGTSCSRGCSGPERRTDRRQWPATTASCLRGVYLSAINRCAPPGNRPSPEERDRCLPFLDRELDLLPRVRTILGLGAFAWDGALRALASRGHVIRPKPRFGHAAEVEVGPYTLIGCFHPSQQNTFTGKLTPAMLDQVLERALASATSAPAAT